MALRQIVFLRQALVARPNCYFKNGHVRSVRTSKQLKAESSFGPKKTLTPFDGNEGGYIDPSKIWKALTFSCAFGVGTFAAVSIWEYEKIRGRAARVIRSTKSFGWVKSKIQSSVQAIQAQKDEVSQLRKDIENVWNRLSAGEQLFVPLCALNVAVFGLWRIPRFQPFMIKYFCSNPAARAVCWPMVLSTFSHYSAFHLFANMYVLHSFSTGAVNALGKEQFLGLYLSAGVFSSLASYVYKAVVSQPGLSLGASGAIMAILAYVCARYPETQLSILFLPMYTFSAAAAIKVIMGIDLAGILLGWKFFDHAAHLGGASLGLLWCYYGQRDLWPQREHLIGYWHQLRGPITKS